MRYLKGTNDLSLFYPKTDVYDLKGYSDVDYAGDLVNRKSTSGMVQFLGSCLVSSCSKKQNIVALSTAEAEYVAAAACCSQMLWIKQQLGDFGKSLIVFLFIVKILVPYAYLKISCIILRLNIFI